MDVQVPPLDIDKGLQEYLFRQNSVVNSALSAVNGIAIRDELPDRPREGKLYYIYDDGLYFSMEGAWHKIQTTIV